MEQVIVLDRIPERHPDVKKEDAEAAWINCVRCAPQYEGNPDRYIAIGFDNNGRELELIAVYKPGGYWLIIHAQTPAQDDLKRKLGFERR